MEIYYAIFGFGFTFLLLDALGRVALFALGRNSFLLRISLGVIIAGMATTALGFLNLLSQQLILALAVVSYLLLLPAIKSNLISYYFKLRSWRSRRLDKLGTFFLALLSIYFLSIFLSALTPPLSRDAINYHLYLPKIWLQKNRIFTISNNLYSFFPSYWEMFISFLLPLSNDITPKLYHLLFLILLLYLTAKFLRLLQPEIERNQIFSALLAFLSLPLINRLASWAYLDISLWFYSLLSLYLLIRFYQEQKQVFFHLSSICLGFSLGMKYLSWIWAFCLFLVFLEKENSLLKATISYSKLLLVAILTASPFYIRNFIQTANPFFPFLYSIFDGKFLDQEKSNLIALYFQSFGPGRTFKDLLLLPLRLSLWARFDQPQNFDGQLHPLYLVVLCLLFKRKNKFPSRSIVYIIPLYTLIWFLTSQQLRFLIPVLILLTLVFGFYLREFNPKASHCLLLAFFCFYLYFPISTNLELKPWNFILGKESRSQFWRRRFRFYPLIEYVNASLPKDAKLMLLNLGPTAYFFEREIFQESIFEDYTFRLQLKKSPSQLASYLRQEGVDFILLNQAQIRRYLLPHLAEDELRNLAEFQKKHLELRVRDKEFSLYRLLQ